MVRSMPAATPDEPLPARALRQAAARAAARGAGLPLVVLGVEMTESSLDDLVAGLDPHHLLVMIGAAAGPEGVLALDPELGAALTEMQTVGRLLPQPAPLRDPTTADLAMAEPFAHRFLAELRAEVGESPLARTLAELGLLGRFANPRAIALALPDTGFRVIRLSLDLGLPDRQAGLLLALPRHVPRAPEPPPSPADPVWSAALGSAVMDAPCTLNAILHRLTLSLGQVEGFTIGQVLPLPGVSVSSVRLEGPGGLPVAPGKLGQMGGLRAVRLMTPRPPQMEEMLPPPG
jgi:flagellar motor switch protein FliM